MPPILTLMFSWFLIFLGFMFAAFLYARCLERLLAVLSFVVHTSYAYLLLIEYSI